MEEVGDMAASVIIRLHRPQIVIPIRAGTSIRLCRHYSTLKICVAARTCNKSSVKVRNGNVSAKLLPNSLNAILPKTPRKSNSIGSVFRRSRVVWAAMIVSWIGGGCDLLRQEARDNPG